MREGFYTEGATWNLERWHRSCLQHSFVMKKKIVWWFCIFVTETKTNRPPISVSLCRHLSLRENTQLGIFSSPWNNLSIIFNLHLLIFCLRQETTGLRPETKPTSYWWPFLRTTPYYNEQEWNHSGREDIFLKKNSLIIQKNFVAMMWKRSVTHTSAPLSQGRDQKLCFRLRNVHRKQIGSKTRWNQAKRRQFV